MIVAELKPLSEIEEMTKGKQKFLLVGCATCTAICFASGKREVSFLASQLKLRALLRSDEISISEKVIKRQCEREFVEELKEFIGESEVILSLSCGVGVQTIADCFPEIEVYPALNTTFIGRPEKPGVWSEYCLACGDCLLYFTAGVCPIARCAKGLLNGPCGGSHSGKCEVSEDIPCAWELIYRRLKSKDRLNDLERISPPKKWKIKPGRVIRKDMMK